jgi:hypothetical protein
MSEQPLTRDLAEVMESLRRALEANEAKKKTAPPETPQNAPKQSTAVIQLPLWPGPVRAMPNPVLRSALLSAVKSKGRRFINDEAIATVYGVQVH